MSDSGTFPIAIAKKLPLRRTENGELLTAAEIAKFDRPNRNNHFPHEVEPSERLVAVPTHLPRVH
jgi:hypothetical protein